jgi:hypothetical protein
MPQYLTDAVQTMFARDIAENLFPDNSFVSRAISDDEDVSGVKVTIAESGDNPEIHENPRAFPIPVKFQEDKRNTYDIDEFVVEPIVIRGREEEVVAYNKRANIMRNQMMSLETRVANKMAYHWSATGVGSNIVRTTGTNRAVNTKLMPNATGTRKKIIKADLLNAGEVLASDDVPLDGRILLIPSDMYRDILEIEDFIDYNRIGNTDAIRRGVIGFLLGMEVMMRSRVLRYTNAGTPVRKLPTAAGAADDNNSALIWHPRYVRRAKGTANVIVNVNAPGYSGGTVLEANIAAGGVKARLSEVGVVSIVQSA